ncbi:glycosyltransferase family 32 protein [Pseudomonas sp. PDM19]|uniref:glycosyltransferase family 32 protein n=1 Tax=Pseudomonas sp. PDM19 TaxID=2769272 RepID=UPI00298C5667|nr:glycosyltransferase [Pseudomonas sp. PDM19]
MRQIHIQTSKLPFKGRENLMIPKIIHYCWYGYSTPPKMYERCIASWKQHLPEYKIQRWDLSNTDLSSPFLKNCFQKKHWAFISDYIRMKALHQYGGIYLDCDMEIIKDISPLLNNDCFLGYESKDRPTSGIIGCIQGHSLPKACMEIIDDRFKRRMPYLIAPEVVIQALSGNTESERICIYEEEYFYPYNPYDQNRKNESLMYADITENTYAIHHWGKSWSQSLRTRALKKTMDLLRKKPI